MSIVAILGESAQIVVTITLNGLIGSEVGIPCAIIRCPDGTYWRIAEIVGATIALRIVVTVLIDELEIDLTEDWLAIGEAGTVVPVLGRGVVIATGDVAGVVLILIEHHNSIVDRLASAIAPVTIELEGDVTACGAEFAVELKHTAQVFGVAIADVVLHTVVLHNAEINELTELLKGIGDVLIGILIKGSLLAAIKSVVGVDTQSGAEQDIGHGVGLPLNAHLGVPAVTT